MKLYDFKLNKLNGESFDLSALKGKKVVLVNVASECGHTFQYKELEEISQEYATKNVVFIGVPCNDFGAQEPGTAEQIQAFCTTHFGVTFPLTEKIHTTGESIHPLYKWLTDETQTEVHWNFQKYLIDETGNVVKMVAYNTLPSDDELMSWLKN